ncbi:hypothetical protein LLG96_04455 [bacterium]|nr:hypothetical protein [bacterium]
MQETHTLHPLDYLVVLSYFAIVIYVGMSFKKYIRQAKDYFAAGAAVPWWLAGISLWMASFSAMTFVIYSQLAYKYGFVSVSLCWVVIPAMIVAAVFLSSRWRRARVMTPLGFMEQRYNRTVHQIFVWTGIPLRMIDNSIRVLSTAIFLTVAIGQSWFTLEVCIGVVGIIMILYTILGGQWAVLITDFFQFFILCLAVFILFPLSLIAVGGFGGLVSHVPESFFHFLSPPYGVFDWVMFAVMITLSYNATWGLVQKYNCVATEADARKVAILMGALSFVGPLIFFVPAMAGRILLPELMDKPGGSAEVYVAVALRVLPTGIMGLLVAGMFSATLSTLGNDYNVLSGVLTKDFYGKVIRPDADEVSLIKWGRINTAIIGLITIVFAIGINYVKGFNLYDIMVKAFGALGPAIMLPLIGGLFLKRINARGAMTGVLAGTLSGVGLVVINTILLGIYKNAIDTNPVLSYWLKQGFNSMSIGVNIFVTYLGMWAGTRFSRTPEDEKARVAEFFKVMDVPTEPKVEKAGKVKSPFSIVSIAIILMAVVLLATGLIMQFMAGDRKALVFNLIAAGILFLIGIIMWIRTRSSVSDS